MLTRIKTGNITNLQVLKIDLGDNVVDAFKLDTPSIGNPGDVLTTDGAGNLLFSPVGGVPVSLASLTDVDPTGAQYGDVLRYDGVGNWIPSSLTGSGIFLNSIEDVTITAPIQAQYLRYDGADWINAKIYASDILNLGLVAITNELGSLNNVDLTGLASGKVLKYTGSTWVPGNAQEAETIDQFDDVDTTTIPPDINDTLVWNGTQWVPGAVASSIGDLTDVDTATVTPGNGDALVFNGTSGKWEPLDIGVAPSSSNTYVVNTIAERNALSPAVGDQVFVRTGTDGEWQMWLWDGAAYFLISSKDSSETDSNTIEAIVTPLTVSPVLLGNISSGSRVTLVTVRVTVPFDGTPTLTVGDALDNERLLTNDMHDLSVAGAYDTTVDYVYNGVLDTDINTYFNANGATVGSARILVTYV
jgi:hypothetical protein